MPWQRVKNIRSQQFAGGVSAAVRLYRVKKKNLGGMKPFKLQVITSSDLGSQKETNPCNCVLQFLLSTGCFTP